MAENTANDIDILEDIEIREPDSYKVLMHNDDRTTMVFVVYILEKVFRKKPEEAERLMKMVHNTGVGLCGIFTYEIAEAKVAAVHREARQAGYPLLCTLEKV